MKLFFFKNKERIHNKCITLIYKNTEVGIHTHMHTCAYAKYTSVSVDYMMMHIYDIQQIREHI